MVDTEKELNTKTLQDEALDNVVGGLSKEAICKAIDSANAWKNVPESIKTMIKNAYTTIGFKAARKLAEKLLATFPDSKELLELLPK